MKKYGDDADSFHNQGTRVEISKQWHEANQIKHDYSYHSKPKSRNYNAHDDDDNLFIKCPICHKYFTKRHFSVCPNCNNFKYESKFNPQLEYKPKTHQNKPKIKIYTHEPTKHTWDEFNKHHTSQDLTMCGGCGYKYDTIEHSSCPKCGRTPIKLSDISSSKKSSGDGLIAVIILSFTVLFIGLLMLLYH